jgi:general secretion pathway protein D
MLKRFVRKRRAGPLVLACAALVLTILTACSQGNQEFSEGKKAEAIQDYDTAVVHYQRALKADPTSVEYKLKLDRMRFEASQSHVEHGQKLFQQGDLQLALAEFQKAMLIDPASPVAQQETQKTLDAIAAKQAAAAPPPAASAIAPAPSETPEVMVGPPALKPLSRAPINLKMTNDVKMIYDTVAKLAGLTVVFDPDLTSRRVSIELTNVTIEQALDIVSLQAKAFWKPITNEIIFVAPDQAQKRRDYEEEIVRTIYLQNTILPQDLTEIVNALRQLLDLRRVQQFNGQNAIIVRDTPDKVMLAEKIIRDIDKPKPEVVIEFDVLQTDRTRMRDLGIDPGTSASLAFSPPCTSTSTTTCSSSTTSSTTTTTTPSTTLALNQLRGLSTADYAVTLPGANVNALLTDSTTQIIDNPQIRIVDGQDAKLRIGSRVPVATGSFQAGVGVGATGTSGSVINPLVNTQFQYLDVGVIVDVTPRIHPDFTVSMKLSIEVSSVTGTESIGGINQPVISTRKVEHDIRLSDGEVSILGGLVENTSTKTTSGWPGFSQIPFLKYFTADNQLQTEDQEVLIVVTPHVVRMPSITAENLRSIASGTDTNAAVRLDTEVLTPAAVPVAAAANPAPGTAVVAPAAAPASPAPATAPAVAAPAAAQASTARLGFAPATVSLKPGDTTTIAITVQNAQDLFSVPLLLQYDPAVLSVEDVRQGDFLSGGTQPIAIVQRVDKERGQAIVSATRMPNTPGVSGGGTLFGVVVRGVAPGNSQLSILQVNARDSQQRPVQFVTSEASIHVAP